MEEQRSDKVAEVPEIEVSGDLAQLTSVVKSGAISLAFAAGTNKSSGTTVLVPLMTCQLNGNFGRDDRPAQPSVTLAFDNIAFLFMQLGEEYLETLSILEAVSKGGVGPSPVRLNGAAKWLDEGAAALSQASRRLGALAEQFALEEGDGEQASLPARPAKLQQTATRPVKLRKRVKRVRES